MFRTKLLLGCAALALSAQAVALDFEGVYRISEREACADDHIDSVILVADQDGSTKAFLSSSEYGIVYQVHAVTIAEDGSLTGVTTPSSHDAATLVGRVTEDASEITGTVDTAVCPAAWTFTAERIAFASDGRLSPLDRRPTLGDFAGSFATATDRTEGTLRLVRLADDRLAGAFGNELSSRLISFGNPVLNLDANTIDLYSVDDGEIRVKWHLDFGQTDGVLAMQGYGISATGRLYPVSAKKL